MLDTNFIVSALFFSKQKIAWLRYDWQSADIVPLVSKDTASELIQVLAYPKFKLSKDEQALLIADFLPYAETIVIHDIPEALPVIRYQADQMFLTLAVVGKAEALVTGVADIIDIRTTFHKLPIMTLSEFKDWLSF